MLQLIKRYRELILVAVLLLVPLGVFFARSKKPAERSAVDRTVVWLTAPVEKAVAWAVTGVMEGWNGYVALRGCRIAPAVAGLAEPVAVAFVNAGAIVAVAEEEGRVAVEDTPAGTSG